MSNFLEDKDKVNFNELDIFDRVINVKLYTSDENGIEKDVYTIRSDYEIVYPNQMSAITSNNFSKMDKGCFVRKCQYKPSIKLQYKRNSLNTVTMIDLYLSNFFMFDKSGRLIQGFNNETYRVSKVEIAIGYFGQFKALFSGTMITPKQLIDVGFGDNVGKGITTITMSNVEYVQVDKLPPDAVLHIHGFVGNILSALFDFGNNKGTKTEFEAIKKTSALIPSTPTGKRETYLEQVFYETITRQWLKKGTPSKIESSALKLTTAGAIITAGTGMLSDADAEKYGIRVYLSKGAKEYSKKKFDSVFKKDANGEIIKPNITIERANTAEAKINKVENALGLAGFSHTLIDSTGDYIVFLAEELNDIKSLLNGTEIESIYKKTSFAKAFDNKIPAVYNITTDSLCTIVCPFFCFINPFEKMTFNARYALSGIVSYFANFTNVNKNEFRALWQNVSFATVEDINECLIVCTGETKENG